MNCRLSPDPSNFTSNVPLLAPAGTTVEVSPTMATGTLMVKAREHSQVWLPKTSALAAMSCPMSQTEKVTLSKSELGIRSSNVANLQEREFRFFSLFALLTSLQVV